MVSPPHRRQRRWGSLESIPARDFGELLVDLTNGKFVYRIWNHENDEVTKLVSKFAATDKAVPSSANRSLVAAAGFDGRAYWFARPRTKYVVVFRSEDNAGAARQEGAGPPRPGGVVYSAIDRDGFLKLIDAADLWYSAAPLHNMLRRIQCRNWDEKSLVRALKESRLARPTKWGRYWWKPAEEWDPGAVFEVVVGKPSSDAETAPPGAAVGGYWRYLLAIDGSFPGLRACRALSPVKLVGMWPYPTPPIFFVIRDRRVLTVPQTVFDWQHYSGAE